MQNCIKCGQELQDEAKFCSKCGKRQPKNLQNKSQPNTVVGGGGTLIAN